jgi:hypothetical protein
MNLSEVIQPELSNDLLAQFTDELEQRLGLKTFSVFLSGNDIKLNLIVLGKDNQRLGRGTQAVFALCGLADKYHKRIILTPAQKDTHHGTTSTARLVNFYKRFGFKENRGRNKDFSITAGMYRDPM